MSNLKFQQVAILGPGLIGGSIGMVLRERRLAEKIVGVGRNIDRLRAAQQVGALTEITTDLATGIRGAELVIICTPVDTIVDQVQLVAKASAPGQPLVITDVGSTKANVVNRLCEAQRSVGWPSDVTFVGSHPIAGNEKRGAEHGTANLFVDRTAIVTPAKDAPAAAVEFIEQFWQSLGAKTVVMSAEMHDEMAAAVSHLPHLLASAIAASTDERYVRFSGTGWQDTTRIAAGDPVLWRQILFSNQKNVLESLDRFLQTLSEFREALAAHDATRLELLLAEAKQVRDSIGGN